MRFIKIAPFATAVAAFVLPDETVLSELSINDNAKDLRPTENALDLAFDVALNADFNFQPGISSLLDINGPAFDVYGGGDHPPHHGYPHHPHHKPNKTIYELISESRYTTKLAELINEYDDVVELLNSTVANFTVFAPINRAFERIPEHAPKPSKEFLKKVLTYHVSPDLYPAARVLHTRTVPTALMEADLGCEQLPQRLSFQIGLKGLTVDFYARIIAVNIFATNGVIHGVDHIIMPPPDTLELIQMLPSEFSTLELGMTKTGLLDKLNHATHLGGTFFAPSNFAFAKLGPKINGFLFSKYGQKYLKALLQYHVVHNETLYSDAYYKDGHDIYEEGSHGNYHVDLPTLLADHTLGIDIARFGPFTGIKINGFVSVTYMDGVAKDGVVHVVSDVLIPPKKLGGAESFDELTVEEFCDRLEPYVETEAYTEAYDMEL